MENCHSILFDLFLYEESSSFSVHFRVCMIFNKWKVRFVKIFRKILLNIEREKNVNVLK